MIVSDKDPSSVTTDVPQLVNAVTKLTEESCPDCGEPAVVERAKTDTGETAELVLNVRCSNESCRSFEPGMTPWTGS